MRRRDYPQVVFGQKHLDVLWSKKTHLLILRAHGHEWRIHPHEGSILTLMNLFYAHRAGRLLEHVQSSFGHLLHPNQRFYRVGKIMCFKPYSQDAA